MGTLYLVERMTGADDLSLRAVRIMKRAAAIVAGNLPAARALLDECGIEASPIALPDVQGMCDLLADGDVAWLDRTFERPHAMLSALIARGIELQPLPGGVDAITALVLSGLPADRFAFYPAIPADLEVCAREPYTLLFAVTPEDWPAAVQALVKALGNRRAALHCTEWTWRGRLPDAPIALPAPTILVVEGSGKPLPIWDQDAVRETLCHALSENMSPREAAQIVAGKSGWSRRKLYALAIKLQQEHSIHSGSVDGNCGS